MYDVNLAEVIFSRVSRDQLWSWHVFCAERLLRPTWMRQVVGHMQSSQSSCHSDTLTTRPILLEKRLPLSAMVYWPGL